MRLNMILVENYKDFIKFYNDNKYNKKFGNLMSYEEMANNMPCDKVSDLYVKKFDRTAKVIIGFYPQIKLDENVETHAAILINDKLVVDFTIRQFKKFKDNNVPTILTKEEFIKNFKFKYLGIGKSWSVAYDNVQDL